MPKLRKRGKRSKRQPTKTTSKKPLHSLRGKSGRFVSKEDHQYFVRLTAEEVADVYDDLFRPGWSQVRKEKATFVKNEKIDRYDRAQLNSKEYSGIPLERANADLSLIRKGVLPKPISVRRIGDYNEYIWAYRGQAGKRVVNQILIHDHFPPDTWGATAYGTGYGKQAVWAGTRTSTPLELLNDTSYLALASTGSGKVIADSLADNPTDVWWEIKLVTKGEIPHAKQYTKATVDDATNAAFGGNTSAHRSGAKPKPAKHVRRRKGSKRNKSRKPVKRSANKAGRRKTRNRRKKKN